MKDLHNTKPINKIIEGDKEKFIKKIIYNNQKKLEEKKGKLLKYLPTFYADNVINIDYNVLKLLKKSVLIFDLDNTLIEYSSSSVNQGIINLITSLKQRGFKVFIISNSKAKKVKKFASVLKVSFLGSAFKPLKKRVSAFAKKMNFTFTETVFVGDQLMTDILLANKLGSLSVLVKPLNIKVEPLRTKFNRSREKRKLNYLKSNNLLLSSEVFK